MSSLLKEPYAGVAEALRDATLEDLEAVVQGRLAGRVKNLRLVRSGEGLVIRGQARSYYAKQLAQHAVMSSSDCPIYGNEITVE